MVRDYCTFISAAPRSNTIWGIWLVILFTLCLNACGSNQLLSKTNSPTNSNEEVKLNPNQIKVCYSASAGANAVVWYAYEKGLFKKYNLNTNLVQIRGGSKSIVALVTKQVDICQMAGSSVVNAVVSGQDVVLIADFYKTNLFSLFVKPEIKTANDLRNQVLASNEPGGAIDAAIDSALQHFGLNATKDIKILRVGDHGDRLAAMESDRVVGTVLTAPLSFKAKAKGYRELLDIGALNVPYSYVSIVSTKSYLKQNPAIVRSFLKANIEAIAMMKRDREGYVSVLAKYLNLDAKQDAEILKSTYENVVQKYLLDVPYPNLLGIQAILASLQKNNTKAERFKAEDMTDSSYIQTLERDGSISKIKASVEVNTVK